MSARESRPRSLAVRLVRYCTPSIIVALQSLFQCCSVEDLDAQNVAVHAADTARHLTECTGTIGQPDPHHEEVHRANVAMGHAVSVATV